MKPWGQWPGTPDQAEPQRTEIKYCAWEDCPLPTLSHGRVHTPMSDSSILTLTASSSVADVWIKKKPITSTHPNKQTPFQVASEVL